MKLTLVLGARGGADAITKMGKIAKKAKSPAQKRIASLEIKLGKLRVQVAAWQQQALELQDWKKKLEASMNAKTASMKAHIGSMDIEIESMKGQIAPMAAKIEICKRATDNVFLAIDQLPSNSRAERASIKSGLGILVDQGEPIQSMVTLRESVVG